MTVTGSANQRAREIETEITVRLARGAGLEPAEIDAEENLLTSGLVDSVGMMRLIADLEELLEVSVPPPDLVPENFRSVRTMARYFDSLPSEGG